MGACERYAAERVGDVLVEAVGCGGAHWVRVTLPCRCGGGPHEVWCDADQAERAARHVRAGEARLYYLGQCTHEDGCVVRFDEDGARFAAVLEHMAAVCRGREAGDAEAL